MKRKQWKLLASILSGEPVGKEEEKFLKEKQEDSELNRIYSETERALRKADRYFEYQKYDADKAWRKVNSQLKTNTRNLYHKYFTVAAIAVVLLAAAFFINYMTGKSEMMSIQTATNDFSRPLIELNDGSSIRLNQGSSISYPKKFGKKERKIQLRGEAFFEVTPDKDKPFVIETVNAQIRVLGTSFNVNAYDEQQLTAVTVKTGKVELKSRKNNTLPPLLLAAGEQGLLRVADGQLSKHHTSDYDNSLAWTNHQLRFNYTPLNEAIRTIEKVYGVNIRLEDGVNQNQPITASFNQQNVEYILDVLALTLQLEVSTENNDYQLSNK
jgi:ferric-dicitrate binding protein FerR (iron transport regulator)